VNGYRVLAVGVGAIALLSGCGGHDFAEGSADDIVTAASADMKELSSMRMHGELILGGEDVSFDVSLDTGGDCQGSLSGVEIGHVEFVVHGGQSWVRPDKTFWRASAGKRADDVIALVGDKWVVLLPGDDDFLEPLCDLDARLRSIGDGSDPGAGRQGTDQIDGQDAVIVTSTTADGDPVKMWVATDDPHHVVKLDVPSGDEAGTVTFSDFDADLGIEAPAESDTIDLDSL
jgi:hypothetical protein